MGDDAGVQCPKSRTGNKYLGHGPQTLARLCPTFSGYESSEVMEVIRFIQQGWFKLHFVVLCLNCAKANKNVMVLQLELFCAALLATN